MMSHKDRISADDVMRLKVIREKKSVGAGFCIVRLGVRLGSCQSLPEKKRPIV
jgi:hypothetical protein